MYAVFAAIAIVVTFLLLIVFKLGLGLAQYCITAEDVLVSVGAILILKWRARSSSPVPQYVRVTVLNYQNLQRIFAVNKDTEHTKLKRDEKFSPIVTIVDDETQQIIDCMLLPKNMKPPKVRRYTLFCYISVHVHDTPKSSQPQYNMESQLCNQGKLCLVFTFYSANTDYNIRLSIHSIADSEGVKYMCNFEDFVCNVRVIDQNQYQWYSSGQHGAVRVKNPPSLKYTGPLVDEKYHKIAQRFEELYSPSSYEKLKNLAKGIVDGEHISIDLKLFALCWDASSECFLRGNYEDGEQLLNTALVKAKKQECENGLLLEGMAHRIFAAMYYDKGDHEKTLGHIQKAKFRLYLSEPSKEIALVLYREILENWRELSQMLKNTSADLFEQYESTEENCELLLGHAKCMQEYEKPYLFLFLTEKAKFHLRTLLISEKLPPKKYKPTPNDLKKAKECLDAVSLDMLPSKVNLYAVNYYYAHCDLCLWNGEYTEAIGYVKKAKEFYSHEKNESLKTRTFNKRIKLLEELKAHKSSEEEEIDELLKQFS